MTLMGSWPVPASTRTRYAVTEKLISLFGANSRKHQFQQRHCRGSGGVTDVQFTIVSSRQGADFFHGFVGASKVPGPPPEKFSHRGDRHAAPTPFEHA